MAVRTVDEHKEDEHHVRVVEEQADHGEHNLLLAVMRLGERRVLDAAELHVEERVERRAEARELLEEGAE